MLQVAQHSFVSLTIHVHFMKQYLLPVLCLLFSFTQTSGQANYYSFQKHNITYTELVNDTPVVPANFSTGDIFAFELKGDSYSFFGKNYMINDTSVSIAFSNSGHMKIEDDSTFIIIDGLFYYMDSIDGNSRLSYKVEDSGNNKILKVQWKNLKVQSGPAGNYVNFQMWIHQSTGMFDIYYGPSSANNQSGYNNQSGPNVGMFYSLKDFSKMFEKLWVNGTPSAYTLDTTRNVTFNGMHGVPANGTLYRFIPKIVLGIASAGTKQTGFTIYPNPANERFTIGSPVATDASVIITDVTGKVVRNYTIHQKDLEIETTQVPAGNYVLTIKTLSAEHVYQLVINH